jgi:hypothetical protein
VGQLAEARALADRTAPEVHPERWTGAYTVQAAARSDCSKLSGLSIPIAECRRTLL